MMVMVMMMVVVVVVTMGSRSDPDMNARAMMVMMMVVPDHNLGGSTEPGCAWMLSGTALKAHAMRDIRPLRERFHAGFRVAPA